MKKTYRGRIAKWSTLRPREPAHDHLGYMIVGTFLDHPRLAGREGHTSLVVKHNHKTGYIETLNSRYKLV